MASSDKNIPSEEEEDQISSKKVKFSDKCKDESKADYSEDDSTEAGTSSLGTGATPIYIPRRLAEALLVCEQSELLIFSNLFSSKVLDKFKKVGAGSFSEVYCLQDEEGSRIYKIIPCDGYELPSGLNQPTLVDTLTEVKISLKLSELNGGKGNKCPHYPVVKACHIVRGTYPTKLINHWKKFKEDEEKREAKAKRELEGPSTSKEESMSEEESPAYFKDDQIFFILEMNDAGVPIEEFGFQTAEQAVSAFFQVTGALAVAEKEFQFEHRDLHTGNILACPTTNETFDIIVDGKNYRLETKGIQVTLIDFAQSRLNTNRGILYNDLSRDPTVFLPYDDDYQSKIYSIMREKVRKDWRNYDPSTNVLWLDNLLRQLSEIKYAKHKSAAHASALNHIKNFQKTILEHTSAYDLFIHLTQMSWFKEAS